MTTPTALLILRIIFLIGLLLTLATFAHANTCVYKTEDVGTIVGVGANSNLAFTDAALQCFDRHAQLYRRVKKTDHMDEESALVIIDMCANIKCQ